MKHLSYQTFCVMENQPQMSVTAILDKIMQINTNVSSNILESHGQVVSSGLQPQKLSSQECGNIKKRVYDILNTLNKVGFLEKVLSYDKGNRAMKKNRRYALTQDSYNK